jgi:predicted ArsR family transcriptional regulator
MSDTWVERTSAFDRIKGVSLTLSEPRPTAWIAEEARVSENTARSHLGRLVELGVLTTTATERGTAYVPDPIYTRSQDIRDLLDTHGEEDLAAEAVDLQAELEAHRRAYDVDTPGRLRASVAEESLDATAARERLEAASDWEYARYRLSLVRDALEHYDTYTSPPRSASA